MKYNPEKHHRRSIRLQGYDYSQEGLYFITICVKDRACIFGEIENGKMILNEIGKIASEEWLRTESVRSNVVLHEFVVMPNHFHAIIEITKNLGDKNETGAFRSPSQTIGSIVRGYKIATLKKIKDHLGSKGESRFTPYHGEESKGEESKGEESKGELRFAPTAPTIWQRNYYERIIKDEKAYINISNYIINNPKNWNEDSLK